MKMRLKYSQSDKASLKLRIRRSTTTCHKIFEALPTTTNQGAMKFALNGDCDSDFLRDLIGNSKDCRLGSSNSLFGSAYGDVGYRSTVLGRSFDVDLSLRVVLDLVDRRASFTEDARNRTRGNSEFDDVVGLFFEVNSLRYKFSLGIFKRKKNVISPPSIPISLKQHPFYHP